MASIPFALEAIKTDPLKMIDPERCEEICRELEYDFRVRDLPPGTTLGLFVQQVAHGNAPCSEVRHIAGESFSPQAYCKARARIPLAVYQAVLTDIYQRIVPHTRHDAHLWHGHRTFHIDGSTFSMPDTAELRKAFGTPSGQAPGCGFPVAHLLVLFHAATGLLIDTWASPLFTSDLAEASEAQLHLDEGDILIGDDTFSGYPHLALLKKRGLHGLFPVHHKRIVDFKKNRPYCPEGKEPVKGMPRSRWIKSLGKEDQLVEYFKPAVQPNWMTDDEWKDLPESMIVRELRRTVTRPGAGKITITLVTTLIDPEKYPANDLLDLYSHRWDVETCLSHVKTTMKMDVLRCKTEDGVRKELVIFSIVYNLVRLTMLKAAQRQSVPVSRISFADTYKWLRHAPPGEVLRLLIVNPRRRWRIEPRCIKRRRKQYDLMNKPRDVLRKELKNQRKTA